MRWALEAQVRSFPVPCMIEPSGGFPTPPKCPDGVPEDSPVEVILSSYGEGAYALASEVKRLTSTWLQSGVDLYAVIDTGGPADLSGERYKVVFKAPDGSGPSLWISETGVVAFVFDPAKNVEPMALLAPGWQYLIPPP